MIVWHRHIWLSAGRTAEGVNVLVPMSVPHMTVRLRGVLHAAKPTLNSKNPRRKTIDTLCGKRAYPVVLNIEPEYAVVPVWPIPTRFELGDRCSACGVAADRKRPDQMYREMTIAGAHSGRNQPADTGSPDASTGAR